MPSIMSVCACVHACVHALALACEDVGECNFHVELSSHVFFQDLLWFLISALAEKLEKYGNVLFHSLGEYEFLQWNFDWSC